MIFETEYGLRESRGRSTVGKHQMHLPIPPYKIIERWNPADTNKLPGYPQVSLGVRRKSEVYLLPF